MHHVSPGFRDQYPVTEISKQYSAQLGFDSGMFAGLNTEY